MSQIDRTLHRANEILRELDSVFPGENSISCPKFQWVWCNDLVTLVPEYDYEGKIQFDYICGCGKDRRVHDADCDGVLRGKVRLTKISSLGPLHDDPRYVRSWVLCRWVPPPPFEDWVDGMGTTEDYPANGRYQPVSRGTHLVAFQDCPTEEHSHVVVKMIKAHSSVWRDEMDEMIEKSQRRETPRYDEKGNVIEPAHPEAKFHNIKARIKDAMAVGGHTPGKKDATLIFSDKAEKETVNA